MRAKQEEELRKSGEIDKELKNMESYLASKKLQHSRLVQELLFVIKQQGTSASVSDGDTVAVKYTGRILATDSVFNQAATHFLLVKQP